MPKNKKEEPKNKVGSWLKETARDALAIGSIAFCFIAIGRATIGVYLDYVYQLLASFMILFLLTLFVKKSENHLARGLILVIFTSLFYYELKFTVFAIVLFIIMLASSIYLKIEKKAIAKGLLLGAVSSFIAYYLVKYLIISLKLPL